MSRTSEFTGQLQAEPLRGVGAATPADAARSQQDVLRGLDGKQVCPFCGAVGERSPNPCPRCGMDNTPEARKATKSRIGPWYVLQARNPAAPGMRFDTLLTFVRKGRVRARSVVRGPTTHQLWRFAAHVKGLSREFGLCFSCGSSIETTANICPQCNRLQEPPINPDVLLDGIGAEEAPRTLPVGGAAPALSPRELPDPAWPAAAPAPPAARTPAASAAPPAPLREPEFDEADIVVPALGGFGLDDLDPKPIDAEPLGAAAPTAPAAQMKVPAGPAPAPPAAALPRTPAEENPFSIAPARRKANGDAGFLSAKELAAAFKLGFDPSAELDRVDIPDPMPAGASAEGMLLPPVTMPRNPLGPHAPPRRGGAFRKFLLFLFVLAGSGFAVLMWVDPILRQKTIEWFKATFTQLRSGEPDAPGAAAAMPEDEFHVPMPEAPVPTTGRATASRDASLQGDAKDELAPPGDRQPDLDPPVDRGSVPDWRGAGAADDREARAAADRDGRPAATRAKSRSTGVRQRPRASAKAAASPRVMPEEPAVAGSDPPDQVVAPDQESAPTLETMKALQSAALDAESEGDYAAAVKLYEQIEKLPEELHPSNLATRLRIARSQLK